MKHDFALHLATNWCAPTSSLAEASRRASDVEIVSLPRGTVFRLESRSRIRRIEVKSGLVWLTATPANGDILLRAGEGLDLKKGWPFVIEALEAAELFLFRNTFQPGESVCPPALGGDGKKVRSRKRISPP